MKEPYIGFTIRYEIDGKTPEIHQWAIWQSEAPRWGTNHFIGMICKLLWLTNLSDGTNLREMAIRHKQAISGVVTFEPIRAFGERA